MKSWCKTIAMKTENYLLVVVLVIFAGCSNSGSTNESTSNRQPLADTSSAQALPVEAEQQEEEEPLPDEPPIDPSALTTPDFTFSANTISTDEREKELLEKLDPLVKQYREEKYSTIQRSYIYDDAVGYGKVREYETWYYNANRQLRAYTSTYNTERTSSNTLYICSDEELLAVSTDNEFQDEGPRAFTSVRIVSSLCPQCGLTLAKEEEEEDFQEYQAYEIDQSSFDKYATDFFAKHENMLETFQEITKLTKIGERYSANVLVNSDTIKYSIDTNLVRTFFRKALREK